MINELFEAIDCKDPERFSSFLSSDCIFRFANNPNVTGLKNIREYITGFFDSIDSLKHDIVDIWEIPGGITCHGFVSYTRKNGSVLTVPFANIFKTDSTGIVEYLIFANTSQLYT